MQCKNCIYWEKAEPYNWGNCYVPLPYWADNVLDYMDADEEVECDTFKQKEK